MFSFGEKKTKHKKKPQLAKLPSKDLIIADSGQGSSSHKTLVGSNFMRDINRNRGIFLGVLPH